MARTQRKNAAAEKASQRDGKSACALLLIDVINDFSFPEAAKLFRFAMPAAKRIAALKKRCRAKGVPAIYVNDNFGRWRSDFRAQVKRCLEGSPYSSAIATLLKPEEDDYFILKPKHSAFYQTSLQVLLESLDVRRLVITGFATDICILFTANDAYMRDYQLAVPGSCTAAETASAQRQALLHMKRFLKAEISSGQQMARFFDA